jgi:hypothetical protein
MRNRKRTAPADFGAAPVELAGAEAPKVGMAQTAGGAVTARAASTPARRPSRPAEVEDALATPPAWPIWLTATAVSLLWALAPLAFAVGYRNGVAPLTQDRFGLAVFMLLALGPAVLVWVAAYVLREAQKLAAETRRAQAMAHDMLAPALSAAARAGDVVKGVRDEIVRAGDAAEEARETLLALRQALAEEADRLTDAAQTSVRMAGELTGSMGRERVEMARLAESLDAQAVRVTDAIGQQGRMVADAASLADAQLREAEATLATRAADLAAAAGEAGGAARTAGEDLVRHIARLETAGVGVAEQVRAVESGLGEQRAALITLAHALKADHEGFAAEAETHAGKLEEFISQARLSAAEMGERATRGGESLRQMMAEAADQFRDLAETARAEREEFGQSTVQSLEAVSQAAANQRAQLEAQTREAIQALSAAADQTRDAAARHAASARDQVDQLSEAAFAAGQKANQVFEARLEEARALVEQSSSMVEQAGSATARKLEEGAAAARETLEELRAMLGEIEERARSLPATARGQADHVRDVVAQGMDQLMENARRTADEAHAIDAAFQDRVRRNFEMLSQAVRLMGGAVSEGPVLQPLTAPPPVQPAAAPAAPVSRRRNFTASFSTSLPPAEPAPPEDDELELIHPASGAEIADEIGLRPRLKLQPTVKDEAISQIFEGDIEDEDGHEGEAWTWKDLLASIDGGTGEDLERVLADELAGMNVDPAKLLPRARTDEIAAAVQTGDLDGARQVVKRLAPAAIRRIVRRLVTDDALKGQAVDFVRRYRTLVDDAAVKDPEGLLMAGMLDAEAGRLFLLLDAAAGDML